MIKQSLGFPSSALIGGALLSDPKRSDNRDSIIGMTAHKTGCSLGSLERESKK